MATSVRNTSLKWDSPVIWRNGRTSMPGVAMSTRKYVIPRCLGASGSVRASRMPWWLVSAFEVHTFWPFTTHWSPSRSARVTNPARSLPAPGSLNSWHHISSPRSMAGMNRCRCSSVPSSRIAGPTIECATANAPAITPKSADSSAKITSCMSVPPRPYHSRG